MRDEGRDPSDWLRTLAHELEHAHCDELVQLMEHAVHEQVPVYAGLPRSAGFREGLEQTMRMYCATLAERRGLESGDRVVLHVIGSQRARHGLRPDDVAAAVGVAVAAGWPLALRVLREMGADVRGVEEVSAEALPLTLRFVDEVKAELRIGQQVEHEEQLPAQVRVQATVIDRLLDGDKDDDELYDMARAQALDVRPPCGLLLVTAPRAGGGGSLRQAARRIAGVRGVVEGPGRASADPPHVVAFARADHAEWARLVAEVDEVARQDHVVVLASTHPVQRLADLAPAYRALTADLSLAARARRGPGAVTQRRLGVCRLLSYVPAEERIEFVRRVLGPVLADARIGTQLLEAYEVWLAHECRYPPAAARLDAPVHILRYRLQRLGTLTGIDPRSGESRTELDLALYLLRGWVEEVLHEREQPR